MSEKSKEDSLFQLIRGMSKAEKRYFKVNSTHTIGEKNNYMRLFDALDKSEEYDDAKFRQKHKKEPFIKYLAAEKNYLYELILKVLRAFRADKSRYLKLLGLIQDIDLLHEREMYEECEKRIKKAQKIALEMNYFHINGLLIDWKFKLLTGKPNDNIAEILGDCHAEAMDTQNKLIIYYKYKKLKNDAFLIAQKHLSVQSQQDQDKLDDIMSDPLLVNPQYEDSLISKQEYYMALARLLRLRREPAEEHKIRNRQLEVYQQHPEWMDEYAKDYFYSVTSFLQSAVHANDFAGYERGIELLGLSKNPEHFTEAKVLSLGANQLFYLMNNSRWDEAVKLSNVLEEMVTKYKNSVPYTQSINIKYNAGCLQFIIGKFHDAVDRFDFIIDEKQETYIGQLLASRVLHLICHYEISPPTVVEYLLGSTTRFATKIKNHNEFNDIILKGIKKLSRTIDKGETRQIMTQMRIDLLAMFEQYQFGLGLEETICWLTSRLENRPMLDVVNERLEIERQAALEKIKTSQLE